MGCLLDKVVLLMRSRLLRSSRVQHPAESEGKGSNIPNVDQKKPNMVIFIGGPMSNKGKLMSILKDILRIKVVALKENCSLMSRKNQKNIKIGVEDKWLEIKFDELIDRIAGGGDDACYLFDILHSSRYFTQRLALVEKIDEILRNFSQKVNILFVINLKVDRRFKVKVDETRVMVKSKSKSKIYRNVSARILKYFYTNNSVFTANGSEMEMTRKIIPIFHRHGYFVKKPLFCNFIFSIDQRDFLNIGDSMFQTIKVESSNILEISSQSYKQDKPWTISVLMGMLIEQHEIDNLVRIVDETVVSKYILFSKVQVDDKLVSIRGEITDMTSCALSNLDKVNDQNKFRTFTTVNGNTFMFHFLIPNELNKYFIQKLD